MELRKSLEETVSEYTTKDYVTVSMGDSITSAAMAMKRAETGEAVVVKDGDPIGIVTERDILYKVVAGGRDPTKTQVQQVMSAPVESVEDDAKVGDAIAKMSKLGVRRLAVMKGGRMVGMITQKRIVSGSARMTVELPELVSPRGVRCPYCDAVTKDANELSRHVDQFHLGQGLLEGDARKW